MKPIKPIAWRRRNAARPFALGNPDALQTMMQGWIAEAKELAKLIPTSFPPLDFDQLMVLDKDDLLAAEVSLPLDPACDVSLVRSVRMRRPYALCAELMLVDVSRLPAP